MHETLVLACAEALKGSRQGFGNLFSQVDFLCKHHGVAMRDRAAVQLMRRHSNGHESLTHEDWLYDVRTLSHFIASLFSTAIPHELLTRIPPEPRPMVTKAQVNLRYIRCVVTGWDEAHIYATTSDGPVCVSYSDTAVGDILAVGMQLNLLDCHAEGGVIEPGLVVVEPDYLVDISAIAACFQEFGHHPFNYLLGRLKPRANTQQILLGNYAGSVLDDYIHQGDNYQPNETLRNSFRQQALQFCTCEPFDGQQFKQDAAGQVKNICEAVDVLFGGSQASGDELPAYERTHAILEPSFVCEQLGLQGRVDLMTTDMKLLVEQKSGKNWNLECMASNLTGRPPHLHKEDHYVQLLLYYGVLRYNFHLPADRVDIRLLYSKYPARQGLLVVNFYQKLFREAISLRNRIVAQETGIARQGFSSVMAQLRAGILLENKEKTEFFDRYVRPRAEAVFQPLHQLSAADREYVERMLTFVYREQLARKVGVQEGQGGAEADLWNMPLAEKQETGNILLDLSPVSPVSPEASVASVGPEAPVASASPALIRLKTASSDEQGCGVNFRRGDMVYLYRYEGTPDVRANILYKGVITSLSDTEVSVQLNDMQHHQALFCNGTWAIEHGTSDVGSSAAIRAVHAFCTATQDKRNLLMGRRQPRRDASRRLSHSYHPHYDDILLHAQQARDYYLLQGPPGTGKTSMALRFLVEEELSDAGTILLTAYTNRAVDEICGMLEEAGQDYLRLGNAASCDQRYAHRLLDNVLGQRPKLDAIRQQLLQMRIIVATTSMLQVRPFILQLKQFSLCIVDEASQLLEPNIIGVLCSDSIGRFILIGDHKQLPAVVQQPDDEPRLHDCRLSLFERLLRQERQAGRSDFIGLLCHQGRMHPDIAQFPNEYFYRREQLQPVPCPHQTETTLNYQQPSEDAIDDLLKQHRVLFLESGVPGSQFSQWSQSAQWSQSPQSSQSAQWPQSPQPFSDKFNPTEARIVADLVRRIHRQYQDRFDPDRTVGVIVPYRNQIALIRHEIALLGVPELLDISIDTVERYQGSQRDVIIYSFTVRHPYQLDFLTANCFREDGYTIDRKLNVAMTRARKQLLMTGNTAVLRQNALFANLIDHYQVLS